METYDPHKNTTEVRGGSPRLGNLRVLLLSTGALVVIFAVIFLIYTIMQPSI